MRPLTYFRRLPGLALLFLCLHSATAQIVNIEDQRIRGTNDSTEWYGYVRGSAALSKVRDQALQIQAQTKVQYKHDPHMALLLLNLNLLRAGQKDFAKQAFAHLRYNFKLSPTLVWEAFAQIQTSPIQLLRQRGLLGSGLRWRALKSADGRQRLYLGTAWLWEQNEFSESNGRQAWHRSSNYLSMTFRLGKQTALIGTTYWQPVWGLIRNYRLSSEWVLKVGLTEQLSLTIDFSYSTDKNLPAGAPAETYAWRNGIAWQLK